MRDDRHRLIPRAYRSPRADVLRVHRTDRDPPDFQPFLHTIGNHERGLPEPLLIGTADEPFHRLLNRLGELQRERGEGFEHEELVDFGGKFPVRVIDVGKLAHDEYTVQAGAFYGSEDYAVRQILLSDTKWPLARRSRLPEPYAAQPILNGKSRH